MARYLISGGTGSLGRALTRRLLSDAKTEVVRCLSRDELKQSHLAAEFNDPRLRCLLGDVRDRDRLMEAFQGVETVLHVAALKRLDAIAYDPEEVIKTNVLGTINVVRAAIERGIKRVIVISSDKACAPANQYGVSKLAAEFYAVQANASAVPRGTRIAVLRYGNVTLSRGSVAHVWLEQMRRGDPITITDERMTRFWITLEQAVELILRTLVTMRGGELVVPILPSVRIVDFAEAIAPDYPQRVIGLRPGGEKLHESMISEEESWRTVRQSEQYVITPTHPTWTAWPYDGEPVKEGWRYRSDENESWLSVEEIRDAVKVLG